MRYGIFSDVHSNLEALDAVMGAFEKERIDTYLCVGDCVGYAASPAECLEKVRAISDVIVAGNHDWGSAGLYPHDNFSSYARQAILWTIDKLSGVEKDFLGSLKLTYQNQDLTMVHGTLDAPEEFDYLTDLYIAEETFKFLSSRVCFVGHTHLPGIFEKCAPGAQAHYYGQQTRVLMKPGSRYIVNAGSVGQPRDGNPLAAYCIYDTIKKEIAIKRISYDIEAARGKIIEYGLPRFLADRLLSGR